MSTNKVAIISRIDPNCVLTQCPKCDTIYYVDKGIYPEEVYCKRCKMFLEDIKREKT